VRWFAIAIWRTIQPFSNVTPFFPKLFSPELRRNCETWLPPAAIYFSAHVVTIFVTPLIHATSGCPAIDGFNRIHAILGTSEHCIATHPSDMAVAMMALEAVVHIQGSNGERSVPLNDFYLLPGSTPNRENVLTPGDLITHVTLPPLANGTRSHYLKLRDRASYEFALSSAAVAISLNGNRIQRVRIALGGVGTKPWRSMEAEHVLEGREANDTNFRAAAEAALKGAKPRHDNGFKVELAKRCLTRTLKNVTQSA